MNIQELKSQGIIDEWADVPCRVTEIKEQRLRGKNNDRPMTKCFLTDRTGHRLGAWVETPEGAPAIKIGMSLFLRGVLKEYNGNKYLDYARMEQALPPDAPERPQEAPQATKSQEPDWDAIAEGKVRHGVVCAFIQAGKFDVDIEVVDYWVKYIMNGSVPAGEPEDEEAPF